LHKTIPRLDQKQVVPQPFHYWELSLIEEQLLALGEDLEQGNLHRLEFLRNLEDFPVSHFIKFSDFHLLLALASPPKFQTLKFFNLPLFQVLQLFATLQL
jgi:hypothetical protein